MAAQDNAEMGKFIDFVRENHVQLRSFIRTLGIVSESVDDLAQETFLVAYREMETFDANRDLGAWLRGIARNLVRNELRKEARRRRILNESLSDLLLRAGDEEPSPLDRAKMSALRECVEQLPPKSRSLVKGRYRDGLTAASLSKHTGMTAAAIRQALVRIRRRLRQCVEQSVTEV